MVSPAKMYEKPHAGYGNSYASLPVLAAPPRSAYNGHHLTPEQGTPTMDPDDLDDELDEPDDPDGGGIPDWDIEELIRLDKQINEHEADAIRRRWEYGRAMLAGRGDRQRLPKGALDDLGAVTGNSRRELQYRMKLADLFPTEADMCKVLHLPWYEIIRQHLTAKPKQPKRDKKPERPGKVVDGYSIKRDTDVIKDLKDWDHNIFRKESIATWPLDSRLHMLRWLKRIADRIQT
jgi:hypothetical protein